MYHVQVRFFIAEFYCYSAGLVIEHDGKIHENQKEYDEFCTYLIISLGYRFYGLKMKN